MKLLCSLPKDILVCCSGGIDSIAVAHFLKRQHNVTLYHFNHNTPQAGDMEDGVRRFASDFKLDVVIHRTEKSLKKEAEFRAERIKFLEQGNFNAVTAHHLGDAVESYCLNAFKGHLWKIPIRVISQIGGSRVYHPFLTNPKETFQKYILKNDLSRYITHDASNFDPSVGMRNWVRNDLLPQFKAKQIGLEKIVRKQYLKYVEENVSLGV